MIRSIRHALTQLGEAAAHPVAFLVVVAYAGLWLAIKPDSFDWHAVATLCTWFMTLFIQRAEQRDTEALHAKMDELLRAVGQARTELVNLDDQDLEDVVTVRNAVRDTALNGRPLSAGPP